MRDSRQYSSNKTNSKGKPNRGKQNEKDLQELVLPYQFIPFEEGGNGPRYHTPYQKQVGDASGQLPRHDSAVGYSGTIEYEIRPQPRSPLALELRKKWQDSQVSDEEWFLSGSQIRGHVRTNAEIMSHSFPEFVNMGDFFFRDYAIPVVREEYSKILFKADTKSGTYDKKADNHAPKLNIAKAVRAGFLIREDNHYYVIPAEQFGNDEYFKTIKEHELLSRHQDMPKKYRLFQWKDYQLKLLQKRDSDILELTNKIKKYDDRERFSRIFQKYGWIHLRTALKKELKSGITDLNDTEQAGLRIEGKLYEKIIESNRDYAFLNRKRSDLIAELKRNYNNLDERFLELYSARWMLKIERAMFYEKLTRNERRGKKEQQDRRERQEQWYEPYEWFCAQDGVYYYSSSSVGTKNTHYIVKPPKDTELWQISDQLIYQYNNETMSRINFPSIERERRETYKKFYDIFNNENPESDKRIVFYLTEGDRIVAIGRTPYLKVPANHSILGLLTSGMNDEHTGRLDYARALFGFAGDTLDEKQDDSAVPAYKSRVRFEPVIIEGAKNRKSQDFLLLSPSATAAGMYLKQTGKTTQDKQRYSNSQSDKPRLRGYKYYLVREQAQENTKIHSLEQGKDKQKNEQDIHNCRYVYDLEGQILKGKIHFSRLSLDELGLLLLSVDVGQLAEVASRYEEFKDYDRENFQRLYELIGGAKPYGYGKVHMKVTQVRLGPKDVSFEALLDLEASECSDDPSDRGHQVRVEAVHAFIQKMKAEFNENYLKSETFRHYLLSKSEYTSKPGAKESIREWTAMAEQGAGYKDEWILARVRHDDMGPKH